MASNEGTKDVLTVVFVGQDGSAIGDPIDNWTSYSITRDQMEPVDHFTLECEDDRADQLLDQIGIGMKVDMSINNKSIMIGFIDEISLEPSRGSAGKRMRITGRDRLGMLSDAIMYPNLGDKTINTTYQFKPTDTFIKVVSTILMSDPYFGINVVYVEQDFANLTANEGFGIGAEKKNSAPKGGRRRRRRGGRGLHRSINGNLARELKPGTHESYLAYVKRIITRAGCQIKMWVGSSDTVIIGVPTYTTNKAYTFINRAYPNTLVNGSQDLRTTFEILNLKRNPSGNNVLHSKMTVDAKDQPSVLIVQGNVSANAFSKSTKKKVVCINELTGYERTANMELTLKNAISSVQSAVDILTSGTNGYTLVDPNQELFDSIPSTIVDLKTSVSRPMYIIDDNSKIISELQFYTSELMAHYQDKYFTLEYQVFGHTQASIIWETNQMVNISDDTFHSTNIIDSGFWIQKIVFQRSRSGGCITNLVIKLPFTHIYTLDRDDGE